MAAKLKRVFSLYALYARMDFAWFTQDTFSCGLCILSDIISNIASVSGILLLSVRFGGIGGFSADEALFMLGFLTLADGVQFMFLGGFNVIQISRRIGRSQVDHMMIQPIPLWMQLLTEGFLPISGNSGLLCGLVLTIIAIIRLGLIITPGWVLLFILLVAARSAISIGASYLIGSSAFYQPAACEEISGLVLDLFGTLGKYPLFGLPMWLTGILVTVIPAGLMAWLPALVLLGKAGTAPVLLVVTIGAILLALGRMAFQKGMKYYVKHGVSRYRDLGHRG